MVVGPKTNLEVTMRRSPHGMHSQRLTLTMMTTVAFAVLFVASARAGEEAYLAMPERLDPEGFRDILVKLAPAAYMSGQPAPEGLERLAQLGVTRVINLRTSTEMDDRETVPYDEAAKVAELGMDYVHIPLGGPDTPYSPESVDAFAKAVAEAEGGVLLHCTVAWRASHMWTAYLVRHQGLSLEAAVDVGRQLNLNYVGLPLEGFLGEELTYKVIEQDD